MNGAIILDRASPIGGFPITQSIAAARRRLTFRVRLSLVCPPARSVARRVSIPCRRIADRLPRVTAPARRARVSVVGRWQASPAHS